MYAKNIWLILCFFEHFFGEELHQNDCFQNLQQNLQHVFPVSSATIAKQFFTTRKDWYRNGVATLQKIGQDWGKRLEKGLNKRLTVRASRC